MLPDFVIIGAMKAGTTSLHHYLGAHPAICMSREKDTNFFAPRYAWDRGRAWYETLFADRGLVLGETSAGYAQYPNVPDVPKNLHAFNPQAKIIYLVRDPIPRIIAHFVHNAAKGRERRRFDEAFENLRGNHYLNCSRYYLQIEQYLEYFDPQQILVVASEDLIGGRAKVLRDVFAFIDVDPEFTSPRFDDVLHRTRDLRRDTALGAAMHRVPGLARLRRLVPFARTRVVTPDPDHAMRARLSESLLEDVEQLEAFVSRKFSHWTLERGAADR